MQIIDTHAHIDQLEDLPQALQRAHEAGVSDIVAMSVDLDSMKKLKGIVDQYQRPNIHLGLGVHPGQIGAQTRQSAIDFIRANHAKARAIGETGLDYWYKWARKDEGERKKQKDFFAMHLDMALEFDLPIVIHSRGAWQDCLELTKAAGKVRALFHWYSGPVDILDQILDAGFYVSTGPSVAYSPESRRAMAHCPLGRILIETDCPVRYKNGESFFTAEPKDVIKAWQALAQLKDLDEEKVLAIVNANAKEFFRI